VPSVPVDFFIQFYGSSPNAWQQEHLDKMCKKNVYGAIGSRQVGKSALLKICGLWHAFNFTDKNICFFCYKISCGRDFVNDMHDIISSVGMESEIIRKTKYDLQLRNNSNICIIEPSQVTIQGKHFDVALFDEYDFYNPKQNTMAYDFIRHSRPKGTKICGVTTPNGANSKLFDYFNKGYIIEKLEKICST
jgi:hypothetical protein